MVFVDLQYPMMSGVNGSLISGVACLHYPPIFISLSPCQLSQPSYRNFISRAMRKSVITPFSFNFFKGIGRTEGEGVECNWDGLNGHGPLTVEMPLRHQWETLDDCCGWINFWKTMGLGMCNLALPDAHVTDCHVTGNLLLKQLWSQFHKPSKHVMTLLCLPQA